MTREKPRSVIDPLRAYPSNRIQNSNHVAALRALNTHWHFSEKIQFTEINDYLPSPL